MKKKIQKKKYFCLIESKKKKRNSFWDTLYIGILYITYFLTLEFDVLLLHVAPSWSSDVSLHCCETIHDRKKT